MSKQPKSTEQKLPKQTYCNWKFCLSTVRCLWVKIFWPDGFFLSELRLVKEEYNRLLVSQWERKSYFQRAILTMFWRGKPFSMNYLRTLGQLDCLGRCPGEIRKTIKLKWASCEVSEIFNCVDCFAFNLTFSSSAIL